MTAFIERAAAKMMRLDSTGAPVYFCMVHPLFIAILSLQSGAARRPLHLNVLPFMKCLLLIWFLTALTGVAQPSVNFEKIVRYHEVVAGQEIEVTIHQRPFDFSKCKLTGGENTGEGAKLDGVEVAGTDGKSPKRFGGWPVVETIAEIELKWNGKSVPVSTGLHKNLFALTLDPDGIQFIPRPSGEELLIQAIGGDGGGSYLVSLVLRKNGKHKQYECGYWESGLRRYPFEVEEQVRTDEDGRGIFKNFPWLKAKAEQGAAGKTEK